MMHVKAFKALRPVPESAAQVAALPYDTMDRDEALALAHGNPDSFLHVSRAEINLPPEMDSYDDRVYTSARANLERLRRSGKLVREDAPCLYLYSQRMGPHRQTGIVVCSHIDDYTENRILRHEKTRADKEDDRTRYALELRAHTGPVFLAYRDVKAIDSAVGEMQTRAPLFDFSAPDAIRHTVWRIAEDQAGSLLEDLSGVPRAYIADGHHRAAAAVRAGLRLRPEENRLPKDAESDWFLSVFFPASQLKILPYHRCVKNLNGLTPREFLAKVSEIFEVDEIASPAELSGACQSAMYMDGRWRRLRWSRPEDDGNLAARLDVSVLQSRLLSPVLGIDDPRKDSRVFFVGGVRGTAELERLVGSGQAGAAFAMWPLTVDRMLDIADAGMEMPPKSTWFEPKMRSGLLLHTF